MQIDIDQLTEEELVELNHRVVARLHFINQMRSHQQMMDFRVGEKVAFQPPGRPLLKGTLTRFNQKTVTIIMENGQQWLDENRAEIAY